MKNRRDIKKIFIVGSPRSGTTMLGDMLDMHPEISRWYEPYFVFDRYFRERDDDCRSQADAGAAVKEQIRAAYEGYAKKMKTGIILDKSPQNSFKIHFINEIFPEAKFIHILRDGRDAVLSISKEWEKRREIIEKGGAAGSLRALFRYLERQPKTVYRLQALAFELGGFRGLAGIDRNLHRIRWDGGAGWGPRFSGWREKYSSEQLLEFNAYQWMECVRAVRAARPAIDPARFMEIRYEDILAEPATGLERIFDFIPACQPEDMALFSGMIRKGNTGKWINGFGPQEKERLAAVLEPMLRDLGYSSGAGWSS